MLKAYSRRSLPLVRLPIEKPTSLLSQEHKSATPILTGMTDPFLYNPRRLSAGQVQEVYASVV